MSSDSTLVEFGLSFFETEIDDAIMTTNEFLCNSDFVSNHGPFFWILQMSCALAAMFSIGLGAVMAYKMMVKNEPFDVLKLFKPLLVAIILSMWYPQKGGTGMGKGDLEISVLDLLAFVPNALGSYTHDLYEAESAVLQDKFENMQALFFARDEAIKELEAQQKTAADGVSESSSAEIVQASGVSTSDLVEEQESSMLYWIKSLFAGVEIGFDKLLMFFALATYRVGWWATIYAQQICLGMLTIFGPIQWAFSLIPKWEGAWAKWIMRYLTMHFYGTMLYFVGFYVLLLFDICLDIQIENLKAITSSDATLRAYALNCFSSSAYMVVASIVSLKCLNLVPDLASWVIPEGETAFSTRNFGEGVAQSVQGKASQLLSGVGKAGGVAGNLLKGF